MGKKYGGAAGSAGTAADLNLLTPEEDFILGAMLDRRQSVTAWITAAA